MPTALSLKSTHATHRRTSMDVLKQLFEQHFHFPARRRQASPGSARRIGPRHRPACRFRPKAPSALSIPCAKRISPSSNSHAISVVTDCRFLRSTPKIWPRRLPRRRSRRHHALRIPQRQPQRRRISRPGCRSLSQGRRSTAALSGRGRPRPQLQSLLSALQLRSPVHRLGPELLQVLLSAPRRHSLQRAGTRKRLHAASPNFCSPRRTTTFSIATFNRATSCCATASRTFSTTRAAAKARCSMTSHRFSTTAKADLPPALRQELLDYYLDCLSDIHPCRSRRIHGALLRLRLRPHHAGPWRLRLPRLLRAQTALPAERALRAQEPALARPQRQACPSRFLR